MKHCLIYSFILLLLLVGCSEKNTQQSLAEIELSLSKNENVARAEIMLKNVLSENAANSKARELLAVALTKQGNYFDAITQFNKIIESDYLFSNIGYTALFESHYFEGRVSDLNALFEKIDSSHNATIPDIAVFMYGLHSLRTAQNTNILASLIKNSSNELAKGLSSSVLAFYTEKNFDDFINSLEKLNQNQNSEKWLTSSLLANTLLNSGDFDKAIVHFLQSIELRPNYFPSYLLLSQAYVNSARYDEAQTTLNRLLAVNPEQAVANQLMAYVKFSDQDFEAAKVHIEKALRNNYITTQNYLFAGVINFKLGNYEQSVLQLERGLSGGSPDPMYYDILLGAKFLVQDGATDFSDSFTNNKLSSLEDIERLNTLLLGYALTDNISGFTELFDGLSQDTNLSLESQMSVAFTKRIMDIGTSDELIGLSQRVLNTSDSSTNLQAAAKTNIISELLKNKEYKQANSKIAQWETKAKSPIHDILSSEVLKLSGNYQQLINKLAARSDEIDSSVLYRNLAFAYYSLAQYQNALLNSAKALQKEPTNIIVLREYVRIQRKMNVNDHQFIESIYSSDQATEATAILKSLYYAMHEDFQTANAVLEQNKPALPSSLYIYTYAETLKALGNKESAINEYKKIASNQYIAVNTLPAILKSMESLGLKTEAKALLYNSLDRYPLSNELNYFAARDKFLANEIKQAVKYLDKIKSPSSTVLKFKGDVLSRAKEFSAAEQAFTQAYYQTPTDEFLFPLTNMMTSLGKVAASIEVLNAHMKQNPESISTKLMLAEHLKKNDPMTAISLYSKVLEQDAKNIYALTNLATLHNDKGDKTQAKAFAEKALKFYPDDEVVKNTMKEID